MHSEHFLSVIIPFRDKVRLTVAAVKTLVEFEGRSIAEILLIDNSSKALQRRQLESVLEGLRPKLAFPIRILGWKKPFNWQRVNNYAARRATGSVLCFLNNDLEFTSKNSGILQKMATCALRADAGVVGCLLRYPEGRIQHAGGYAQRGLWHNHHKHKPPGNRNGIIAHPFLTGACHVIEAAKFKQLGGYDTRFIFYAGDVDLCVRSLLAGFKNFLVHDKCIIHKESKTPRHVGAPANDYARLFESMMRVLKPTDMIDTRLARHKTSRSSWVRHFGVSRTIMKRATQYFTTVDSGFQFIPALPHARSPRITALLSRLTNTRLTRLRAYAQHANRELLIVFINQNTRIDLRGVDHLALSELGVRRGVLWIETMKEDIVFTDDRQMTKYLKQVRLLR